jgi:hypothetical protein
MCHDFSFHGVYIDGWTREGSEFGSSPYRGKEFYSTTTRPDLEKSQPPMQWVPGALLWEADHSLKVKIGAVIPPPL